MKAYVGDPAKIRLIHGGIKETHVFHLHNHQWRLEGDNPNSTIIDSITLSPQECYTLEILHGAGSLNGMIGDAIFHCHLYPHFHEGMWTLWRIYDRLQDGNGKLPDGTPIPKLLPLRDRVSPPEKDKEHPGYPNFINGQVGEDIVSCHTDDCPAEVKVFELALIQAKITYNSYGWHDPQGRFFVRKEELEKHGDLKHYIKKNRVWRNQKISLVCRPGIWSLHLAILWRYEKS